MMENVHSETYSLLIDTYVRGTEEKRELFEAMDRSELRATRSVTRSRRQYRRSRRKRNGL